MSTEYIIRELEMPHDVPKLVEMWRASDDQWPGTFTDGVPMTTERVREWLEYIHPDARDAEFLNVAPYRVHERCVDRFRLGRVLLAGERPLYRPMSQLGSADSISTALSRTLTSSRLHHTPSPSTGPATPLPASPR